jgi:hypothetical protein
VQKQPIDLAKTIYAPSNTPTKDNTETPQDLRALLGSIPERNEKLKLQLESYTLQDGEYWSFRGNAKRLHGHAYFQYPAMMVPQMLSALLETIHDVYPEATRIYDPYVGSGTTLIESMMHGFDFTGGDINPLAILLCKTKAQVVDVNRLKLHAERLFECIQADRRKNLEAHFVNRDKWFNRSVSVELSRIRRAIRMEGTLAYRRFFWVAMAETVRLTSNSRTSTYKLHIRSLEDIETREVHAIKTFQNIVTTNLANLTEQHKELQKKALLRDGRYIGNTDIRLENVMHLKGRILTKHDVLLTSPPYGDNKTTVPYGQSAYLPLQWIDLNDIDSSIDDSILSSTLEIDARSLGGGLRDALNRGAAIRGRSTHLATTLEALKGELPDRAQRVAAFCADLDLSLPHILHRMNPGGLMIWTVGNRSVGGLQVPIDKILIELLQSRGAEYVTTLYRTIPTKRMPAKNHTSATMESERILVLRVPS